MLSCRIRSDSIRMYELGHGDCSNVLLERTNAHARKWYTERGTHSLSLVLTCVGERKRTNRGRHPESSVEMHGGKEMPTQNRTLPRWHRTVSTTSGCRLPRYYLALAQPHYRHSNASLARAPSAANNTSWGSAWRKFKLHTKMHPIFKYDFIVL